jgi:hypothetical protein
MKCLTIDYVAEVTWYAKLPRDLSDTKIALSELSAFYHLWRLWLIIFKKRNLRMRGMDPSGNKNVRLLVNKQATYTPWKTNEMKNKNTKWGENENNVTWRRFKVVPVKVELYIVNENLFSYTAKFNNMIIN